MGTSRRRLAHFAWVVAGAFAVAALLNARAYSHFFAEDVQGFWLARTRPFARFLVEPIDAHVVPLLRVVTYVVGHLAPMNFDVALVVLGAFHALSLYLLYRALQELRPSVANAVLVSWCGLNPHYGILFTWWTASLHRLPLMLFSAAALWAYVRFRKTGARVHAVLAGASFLGAAGFFEKALVVPLLLAGVEVSLWDRTDRRPRRRNWALLAGLSLIGAASVASWSHFVHPAWHEPTRDPLFLLRHLQLSWLMLATSGIGLVGEGTPIAALIAAAYAVFTVSRSRVTAWTWLSAFVVTSVSLAMPALSAHRSRLFGEGLAVLSHRYYPDVLFGLVVFAALAWHRVLDAPPAWFAERPRLVTSAHAALAVALAVLAPVSYSTAHAHLLYFYRDLPRVKRYMDNVRDGLAQLEGEPRPLRFARGTVPAYIMGVPAPHSSHAALLIAWNVPARFVPRKKAHFRILDDGRVQRIKRRGKR